MRQCDGILLAKRAVAGVRWGSWRRKVAGSGIVKADPSPVVGGDSVRGHVFHDGSNERNFADDGDGKLIPRLLFQSGIAIGSI